MQLELLKEKKFNRFSSLKFRAFIKSIFKIVEVESISFKHEFIIGDSRKFYFDDIVFLQKIGVKDKNNVDIYEGDILKIQDILFVAEWNELGCCFIQSPIDKKINHKINISNSDREIIGNIFINSELIK